MDVVCLSDGSYVNVIDVQDLGAELETHGFGLLDGVSQLTVRLQAKPEENQRQCLKFTAGSVM